MPRAVHAVCAVLCCAVQGEVEPSRVVQSGVQQLPTLARQLLLSWSDRVLTS